uniref:Uncharacterized protein n=1 Tax=Thermofilum adornatum TaxID=1365176 RepID=A0A7C1GAQ5_9CREN
MSNFSGKKKYMKDYSPTRRVGDVVHERIGISALIAPLQQEIEYMKWPPKDEEDVQQLDFDTFFARFPPFEPISVFESIYEGDNRTIRLKGDHAWFVLPIKELENKDDLKKIFKGFEKYLGGKVKCDEIICGVYEKIGDKIILDEVIIPRMIYDGSKLLYKEVVFRLTPSEPKLRIYYGLHKVAQQKQPRSRNEFPEILEDVLGPLESERGYSPYALNYITTCYGGYVISTDPTAPNQICDPCMKGKTKETLLCRKYPGRGKFEYRRKIFPKVYSVKSIEPSSLVYREIEKVYTLPYSILLADNVEISKDIEGFVIYFDKVGKVTLNLEKKISTGYFNTNSLMIAFDSQLVRIFVNVLKENKTNMLIKIKIGHRKEEVSVPLYNVLVSKYLWYKVFNRELEPKMKVDEQHNQLVISGFNGISSIYEMHDMEKLIEEIAKESEGEPGNLERFAREVIAHTLAHVVYVSSIRHLPEVENYVDYFYSTKGGYIVSGIFENTKGGMLRASKEIIERFAQDQDALNSSENYIPLNQRILEKIIESGILKPHEDASAEPETRDVEEEMKKIAMVITDKIASKSSQKDTKELFNKVYITFKEFYTLLLNTVSNIVRSKLYIDSQLFVYTILWRLVRAPSIVVSYLKKKTDVDDKEIEVILEELFEAELYKILVEMLFPDMCVDGCGLDLYLPDCHRHFEQPFIISRSLLIAFLEFLGIRLNNISDYNVEINRIDCPGSLLEKLSLLGRKNVHILTSELSENTINLIRNLLQRNDLNVVLEVDRRLMESKPNLIKELKALQDQHKGRLEVKFTQEPHHGKMLDLDNLRIYTSWNFGTSVKPLQTYKAELKTKI